MIALLLLLLLLCTLLAADAGHDVVLSRYAHGAGSTRHHDTIRCHATSTGHHSSLETLFEDFVLPDTIWCIAPHAGAVCSDRTSRTTYKLMSLHCNDGDRDCTASFDCHDLVLERFWVCLVLTILVIVSLVVTVLYATRQADAAREADRHNKRN